MTALSIHLSEKLAKASQEVAEELGLSRTEFIRQAVAHELENFYARRECDMIAKCFAAMRKNPSYLKETKELEGFDSNNLPNDEEEWWKGKK